MEVRCTRNCKKKDKQGRCLAEAISIEETGCGAFIRVPEFEPFRADNVVSMTRRAFRQLWSSSQE